MKHLPTTKIRPEREVFLALDGLRGLAALAVISTHADDYFGSVEFQGGHLAVDLFFCMSGVVIAHAYGRKLDQGLSWAAFMRTRLIRLFPLMLLSVALVVAPALFGVIRGTGTLLDALKVLGPSLLALPTPFTPELFPANVALWSLFFELAINLVAAIFWQRLTNIRLVGLVALSAIALFAVSGDGLTGGPTWDTFHVGVARVSFSFFAGMLIYRLRPKLPFHVPATALLATTAIVLAFAPAMGWLGPLLAVLFVFPSIVTIGLSVQPKAGAIYAFAGRLSYAVYVLHLPIIVLYRKVAGPYGPALLLASILLASYLADRYYDTPVRKFLLAFNGRSRQNEQAVRAM